MKKEKEVKEKANEWCRREGLEPEKYAGWLVEFYFFLKKDKIKKKDNIKKYYFARDEITDTCLELCHCPTAPYKDVYIGSFCCQANCSHCINHGENFNNWIKCDALKEAIKSNLITK